MIFHNNQGYGSSGSRGSRGTSSRFQHQKNLDRIEPFAIFRYAMQHYFFKWATPGLFFYTSIFSAINSLNVHYKI